MATPRTQKVVDVYLRASRAGTTGERSEDVERAQIAAWTARRGWSVGRVFVEAARVDSERSPDPLLGEALGRVRIGESEGVLVARLNQLSPRWERYSP